MKSQVTHIIKEKIIRLNLSKKNIFQKILKSITQNNNIKNNIKVYTNYILAKKKKKHNVISKKHKICLFTGKRSGVLKNFNFSRHLIKKMILNNKLTNGKQHNW